MPDEAQNSIPTENSIPASSQESTLDAPIPPSTSEPVPIPPEAPESPAEAESAVPVNNPSNTEAMVDKDNPVVNQPGS